MHILGIHNSGWTTSAAIFDDQRLIAACPEERLDRQKYSRHFPIQAIKYYLEVAEVSITDIDHIAAAWNPGVNGAARYRGGFSERLRFAGEWLYSVPNHVLGRMLETDVLRTEQVFSLPESDLRLQYVDHHDAHAATAFYPSAFEESAIFTTDGYGERTCTSWKFGHAGAINRLREIHFPHSIGSFYSAITEFLGFHPDGDEWKVMGMSAYGDPSRYREQFARLFELKTAGNYELDLNYFNHYNFDASSMISHKFLELFGAARTPAGELEQRH